MKIDFEDAMEGLIGFFAGLLVMVVIWCIFATITETEQVRNGYLTHKGIRYTVTEYDRLDIPPKPTVKEKSNGN